MRPAHIPQRIPVFVAGEGKSEEGYWRWLGRLSRHVHINAEALAGGDFLEMATCAIDKLHRWRNAGIAHRAIVLDSEHRGNSQRNRQASTLLERNRFNLIWQTPCHEAFLLHHFRGQEMRQPATTREAKELLQRIWPSNYVKGMDAGDYGVVLTPEHVAIARGAEPEFSDFLAKIGWD